MHCSFLYRIRSSSCCQGHVKPLGVLRHGMLFCLFVTSKKSLIQLTTKLPAWSLGGLRQSTCTFTHPMDSQWGYSKWSISYELPKIETSTQFQFLESAYDQNVHIVTASILKTGWSSLSRQQTWIISTQKMKVWEWPFSTEIIIARACDNHN